jgi:hypothetical protein
VKLRVRIRCRLDAREQAGGNLRAVRQVPKSHTLLLPRLLDHATNPLHRLALRASQLAEADHFQFEFFKACCGVHLQQDVRKELFCKGNLFEYETGMIPECPVVPVLTWHGCYADSWKGWIVDGAFAHPAKFARGLIRRILEHGIEQGYWQEGSLVGDPFGGVACGGVVAASLGFRWIGVELEEKFVGLGQENIALHRNWWEMGKHQPVLLQGDSRRFHEVVRECDGVMTSPPFTMTSPNGGGGINKNGYSGKHGTSLGTHYQGGGGDRLDTNIEALPPGDIDGALSSGDSDGQIGREAGETYWSAMAKVYASLFLALKPGGYAAIVVKDYVKDKARVPLCDDTLRLLCHVGFEPAERVHAMLVEHSAHDDLFSGTVTKKKERKSFFRRLAEKKGSPAIDYEEVLFVRKPF